MLFKSDQMAGEGLHGVNAYSRQLTEEEIRAGQHREMVGGMWEELGKLQLSFLKRQGLMPQHTLLDIGCGCLRGGIHLIDYLDEGNYYGVDANLSLLEAGLTELGAANLVGKRPTLLENSQFEFHRFGVEFDYLIAQSVFTHIFLNHIARCLREVKKVMRSGGSFYATYFEAPGPACTTELCHEPGGIVTHCDRDPFHYSEAELRFFADQVGLSLACVSEWTHPRGQKMLVFRHR